MKQLTKVESVQEPMSVFRMKAELEHYRRLNMDSKVNDILKKINQENEDHQMTVVLANIAKWLAERDSVLLRFSRVIGQDAFEVKRLLGKTKKWHEPKYKNGNVGNLSRLLDSGKFQLLEQRDFERRGWIRYEHRAAFAIIPLKEYRDDIPLNILKQIPSGAEDKAVVFKRVYSPDPFLAVKVEGYRKVEETYSSSWSKNHKEFTWYISMFQWE